MRTPFLLPIVLVGLFLGMGLIADEKPQRASTRRSKSLAGQTSDRQPSETDDRISQQCAACIARDSTTAGMLRCTQVERLQRAHELEEVRDQLLKLLESRFDDHSARAFLRSQRRWEQFRDTEFKVIDETYRQLDGTLYLPLRIDQQTELIHQRTQFLRSWINVLEVATKFKDAKP